MSTASPFQELICRVRAGDEDAATELVRLYEPHVRRAVRIRMTHSRLRRVVESMDICQSVLANFFVRASTGQFEIETPRQLVALLVTMAENRVRDWQRRQMALRRDIRREVPLSALQSEFAAKSSQRTGSDAGSALEQVLAQLSSTERRLVERRRAGASWLEIAEHEGKSADALRMQLRRAIDRSLRQIESDDQR